MMDIAPICRSGFSVRWPRSAAVASPNWSAVQAWKNSWRQMEKTTTSVMMQKTSGSSRIVEMKRFMDGSPGMR